jgi:hypothetical protein
LVLISPDIAVFEGEKAGRDGRMVVEVEALGL